MSQRQSLRVGIPLVCLLLVPRAFGSTGTFLVPPSYPAGNGGATSVAVGDFNGDKILDLAVANPGNNSVSILLGNGAMGKGDATFKLPSTISVGVGGIAPVSIAVGDFDGVNGPDLAVANSGSGDNTVSVLLNNGNGTLPVSPTNYNVAPATRPFSVAVGDFNVDGSVDLAVLAVATSGTNNVFLLNNDGTGKFTLLPTNYPAGNVPVVLAVGDFNGDKRPDLVVVNDLGNDVTVLLNLFPSTVSVTSSVNPSVSFQPVTLTATVSCSSAAPLTGTVTFFDGTTVLGVAPVVSGSASLTVTSLGAATTTHSITAVYSGDTTCAGSTSAVLTQTVNKATTKIVVKSSRNPSIFCQTVTFTATITPQFPGTATGTVTFKDGSATLGPATVSGNMATFTTTALLRNIHSITAVYSGDANFLGSASAAINQVVKKAATTTTLTSTPNPSKLGQTVTFTATVTPQFCGVPTGTVRFSDMSGTLGVVPLSGGVATFSISTLKVGSHKVVANYLGDGNFIGSTSKAVTQTVTP